MRKIKNLLLVLALCVSVGSLLSSKALAATCDISKAPQYDSQGAPIACSCPKGYSHPVTYVRDSQQNYKTQDVTNECLRSKTAADCSPSKVDPNNPTTCLALGDECANTNTNDPAAVNKCLKNNSFVQDLNNIVNFLSAAVGIVVIIIIIIGGIQYSLAGDNANAQAEAKTRITNALIALVAFIFTYAFLQWLIPGGL